MKKTRDQILEVAQQTFASQGYKNTTIQDIAKLSGKGRRTVYTYFKDKEDIYTAVVEMEITRILDSLKSVTEQQDRDIPDTLQMYASRRMERLWELVERNPVLKKDFMDNKHRVIQLHMTLDQKEILILNKLFARGVSQNKIRKDIYPEEIAHVFLMILKGLERNLIRKQFSSEFRKRLVRIVRLFTEGIHPY